MTTGAARTRLYRERRRRGVALVAGVEVCTDVLTALIETGRLDYAHEGGNTRVRRTEIAEAISDLLQNWAERA